MRTPPYELLQTTQILDEWKTMKEVAATWSDEQNTPLDPVERCPTSPTPKIERTRSVVSPHRRDEAMSPTVRG